jgi:small GTP-binding protein
MRQSMLTEAQAQLLRDERAGLAEIRLALADLDVPREALEKLQQAILQLDELFLLVVVGEFNAGKSALMNALLGEKVLAEGVLPTTSRITLVKWGEASDEQVVDEGFATFTYPLPLLREVNIVDTPGTNAVIRRHERLTDEFLPRSDLVLFVTSAERPMTESERQFLDRIRSWGKKVVIALNKIDIFENDESLNEVRTFVLKHAEDVLGFAPEFFPVSARLAQQAKAADEPAEVEGLLAASRIEALENYIYETLDDSARLKLKFASPLGVAERLVEQTAAATTEQEEALNEDKETVFALESAITAYEGELNSELTPRLAEVENILQKMQARGLDFFDNTLRLTNIAELARGDRVRARFEEQVLADVPKQIEDKIRQLINWLVDKDLHQWQQVMGYLQRRQARYTEHIVGQGAAALDSRRKALIDSAGKTAQNIIDSYDREKEARELAAEVETTVAQVAMLEVGAAGLGALVVLVVASTTVDITGILAAGTLAVLGLFVIPYKRGKVKEQFREKIEALRAKLLEALSHQFKNEANEAITRVKDGTAPYIRFVRAERARVGKTQDVLHGLRQKISALKGRTQAMK